jgi:hypothetical protein
MALSESRQEILVLKGLILGQGGWDKKQNTNRADVTYVTTSYLLEYKQ